MLTGLLGINLGIGSTFAHALEAVGALFLKGFESGVEAAVRDTIGEAIAASTSPGVGQGWFGALSSRLVPVEALVIAPLLFAATIGAVLRQDLRRLARAWLVCLPVAAIAGGAVQALSGYGLNVTDNLSLAIEGAVAPDLGAMFTKALLEGWALNVGASVIGVLMCLMAILAVLIIWLELGLRSASIEIAVFFMPLAFAGLVWPATAHWAKRLVHILVSLMLVKPVLVGSLCLGAQALTSLHGLSAGTEGLTILLLASFAPLTVFKLVPIMEAAAVSHVHELARTPLNMGRRVVNEAETFAMDVARGAAPGAAAALAGAGGGGDGSGRGLVNYLLSQLGGGGGGRAEAGTTSLEPLVVDHPLGPARPPDGDASGARGTVAPTDGDGG